MVFRKITSIKKLRLLANQMRRDIVEMLFEAKSGHPAGALGLADVFAALYFNVLHHDPKRPNWYDRDRMVLSNGHACPVLYSALARTGYFPVEELSTLRKLNSRLQGHPHYGALPGIENTSGPLGQGLSQAVGMAIVSKRERKRWRVYAVVSDGEQEEGQIWEALLLASKFHLGNLTVIMDRNNIQIDGFTEEVLPLEPIAEKYRAFGWHVIEIDGHNVEKIIDACEESKAIYEKPTMIVAHTIPGKGIPFMEFRNEWHGRPPDKAQLDTALAILDDEKKLIESDEE